MFFRRAPKQKSLNVRDARRRGFFVFQDDRGADRIVDPFRVFRELSSSKTVDIETQLPVAMETGAEPETTDLIEFVCEVFGVKRFNAETKTGMMDAEVLALFLDFSSFLESIKKNIDPGSTSSEPTESKSSQSPEHQAETTAVS